MRFRKIRKPQVFVLLMIAAAIFIFLPREYFGPASNLVGLIAYAPQQAATSAGRAVGNQVRDLGGTPVPAETHEKIRRENLSLKNENVALRQQVAELKATNDALARLRERGLKKGTLIPASVIAQDAAGGRDALLLGKGKLSNVRKGDWVASHLVLGEGSDSGIADQSAVLAHECLVGWVDAVTQVNASVVLLSDPVANRNMNVCLIHDKDRKGIAENGRYITFTLEGAGKGRMRLLDIFHDYVEKEQISVGDWVACQPNPRIPTSLIIGRIEKLERVVQKPIYFNAIVAPIFEPRTLEQVFVVDLSRSPEGS